MQNRGSGKWRSNHGFTNHQALLALLVAFPLGLIALGLLLNVLNKPSPERATSQAAATQNQKANTHSSNSRSSENTADETTPQSSILELGASVNGEPIRLMLHSIRRTDRGNSAFTYQLGNAKIEAMANCGDRSWISYPERSLNRPQSPATEKMLALVCDGTDIRAFPSVAIVHDPPSNVRDTPNGSFLCTIDRRRTIRVGKSRGDWYPTTVCGREGFIHLSQLEF